MFPLEGVVQHYDWGGYSFIPALLGHSTKAKKPHAEYWLGAHPKSPGMVRIQGRRTPLSEVAPDLPFLMKVLDAREMLSIQAHPSRARARKGYKAENAAGIPLDAPHRNYRDCNHKPEVHVALTPFWMLNGFRPWREIRRYLEETPEFAPLRRFKTLRGLVRHVLTMPAPETMLGPLVARLKQQKEASRNDPAYWVLRAANTFAGVERDRGLFFLYLLNLVSLKSGEGTYQPEGVLHAYLEGATVELMANSDNVLRAGLTSKHVDVGELLRVISFESVKPPILKGKAVGRGVRVYRTPSTEFELSKIVLPAGTARKWRAEGPVILLVTEGSVMVDGVKLERGQSVFTRDEAHRMEACEAGATLFEARVPGKRAVLDVERCKARPGEGAGLPLQRGTV
ncbi:MAG: mannose-6-phosphate isomerase, class I [Bryobacterales bacterium]|nr:mannose-6-phosphate isomerase, class I [Bryobacterales bacterium]